MRNHFRGAASLSTFFVLSVVLTVFFLYLGMGVGGAIIAIAISIFATPTFGYKSLDEKYEEDLRNPKYLYPKNNLINEVTSSTDGTSLDDLDEDEYEEPLRDDIQNLDAEYEDESMKRFSDYTDDYYASLVFKKNNASEEE